MTDLTWDNDDAAWLRRQLNSKTGKKFMAMLQAQKPVIKAATMEAIGIEGLKRQTWEEVLNAIEAASLHYDQPAVQEQPFVNVNL